MTKAQEVLFSGARHFTRDLRKIAGVLKRLKDLIARGQAEGLQMAYPSVDARVVESFSNTPATISPMVSLNTPSAPLSTAQDLYSVADKAYVRAEHTLHDPSLDWKVPTYETGPVTIEHGCFWQGGHPMFFTGVGHFGQVRRDVPILNDYGLNIIQIEIGPNSVVIGPDEIDDTRIRQDILATLENAAAHNVAVNLLISPHYFPQWAIEQNPALGECGAGFMNHCIDAPESRAIYDRFLGALMPVIAGHPALHSICLSNEPQYDGRCAHTRARFHAWIEKRHGAIATLNGIYGTQYAAFEDVPFPNPEHYAAHYDYCVFNQDRFLAFHEFLRDSVHHYAPGLPVHAKVMSHAFGDPGKFEVGIDYAAFTRLGAIAGNDCVQTFEGDAQTEYLQRWQDMALNYTFQRSVAPESPVFNSEDHIIGDGDPRFIPASHIRTAYWTQALHGQGAAATWVWERQQGGDFDENILTRANCVRALGHVALDLNRAAMSMYSLQRAPSDAAILYVPASMLASDDFTAEAAAAYEGLYFADTTAAFVTGEQAQQGLLDTYKLLVVPNVSHAPDGVVGAVQAYLDGGGAVVTVADCFTRDEYGRPRTEGLKQGGQGRLTVYPDRLTPRGYRAILDGLMDAAGCERPVRISGPHGEPVWGINLRTVEREGKRLASLVNYGRSDQAIVLHGARPVEQAVDILNQRQVEFPLTVRPLDPVLLSFDIVE